MKWDEIKMSHAGGSWTVNGSPVEDGVAHNIIATMLNVEDARRMHKEADLSGARAGLTSIVAVAFFVLSAGTVPALIMAAWRWAASL